MMGAGQGMAKGGANVGVAQLGAQAAMGVNMAHMMQPQNYAAPPNFAPPPNFQGGQPQQQQPQAQAAQPQAAAGGTASLEARLQKLAALKQQGLISDEDFNARKAKILEEI
jgi:membrane protease subunit (stomatin/prohibitin family)